MCFLSFAPKLEYFGLKSPIITMNDRVIDIFSNILSHENFLLQDGDLIIIASKVVAVEQKRVVDLKSVVASEKAKILAQKSNLSPEFVELVLKESDGVIGAVPGALLTFRQGDVNANAGVDKSNAGINRAILLPDKPDDFAKNFKEELESRLNVKGIGIIIADSTTRPLRIGTVGLAIGSAGLPAIVDIRGQDDLFGYKMKITLRNIADNVASGANILMGESSESIPFVVVRGLQSMISTYHWSDKSISDLRIDPNRCLYFGNMKYDLL